MKECKKKVEQIWSGNKPENVKLKIGYHAGWIDALEMVKRGIFEHQDALDIIEEELEQ